MDRESYVFAIPLALLLLGLVVLVYGVFQGGLTTVAVVGGLVALFSITWLGLAVAAAA